MILVQAPQGASLAYTTHIEAEVSALLNQDKQDFLGSFAVGGFSFSGNAPNYGMMFCALTPWDQRKGKGHSAEDLSGPSSPNFS